MSHTQKSEVTNNFFTVFVIIVVVVPKPRHGTCMQCCQAVLLMRVLQSLHHTRISFLEDVCASVTLRCPLWHVAQSLCSDLNAFSKCDINFFVKEQGTAKLLIFAPKVTTKYFPAKIAFYLYILEMKNKKCFDEFFALKIPLKGNNFTILKTTK